MTWIKDLCAPFAAAIGSLPARVATVTARRIGLPTDLAAALLALPGASGAAEEPEDGTLSLVFENDLFYDTDRNYTNGVRASWLSGPDRTPAWALRAARWFPLFPDGGTVRTSYAVGQNMYTPEDIALRDPPPPTTALMPAGSTARSG